MLQVLASLKNLVNAKRRGSESFAFYLHYRVTFLLLISCSLLITTNQMVGDKINCLPNTASEINEKFLESFCWVSSTYSVNSAYFDETGFKTPYPGVGTSKNKHEHTYRNYYQYIYLCLFIQGLCFYLPHLIWKSIEFHHFNKFYSLLNDLKRNEQEEADAESSSLEDAATYIENRWGTYKMYLLKYLLCELLSFGNLLIQIYMVDMFLHGKFLSLGLMYSAHYGSNWMEDPIHLFPLVTNCYFNRYGAGGTIDVIDTLCILPLNALNAKMYLFIWVWFVALSAISCLNLLHLLLNIFIPPYRMFILKSVRILFTCQTNKSAHLNLVNSGNCGDWFVLSCLEANMESLDFSRFTEEVWKKVPDLTSEHKE